MSKKGRKWLDTVGIVLYIIFLQQHSKRFWIAAISCHLRCSKHTNIHTHTHIPASNVLLLRSKQCVTLLHTNSKWIFPHSELIFNIHHSAIDNTYAHIRRNWGNISIHDNSWIAWETIELEISLLQLPQISNSLWNFQNAPYFWVFSLLLLLLEFVLLILVKFP